MIRSFAVWALLSLCVAASAPVAAQDLTKGRAAFESGDYATALKEFTLLAEQGNSEAQAVLGVMYAGGIGVTQDYVEAVKWTRKAAEQGYAEAQVNLGNILFRSGDGDPQDFAEAASWYRKAATQGHAKAQVSLGVLYGVGMGVPKDDALAYMWFNLAAAQSEDMAGETRDAFGKEMTHAEISKAQKLSRECLARNYQGC